MLSGLEVSHSKLPLKPTIFLIRLASSLIVRSCPVPILIWVFITWVSGVGCGAWSEELRAEGSGLWAMDVGRRAEGEELRALRSVKSTLFITKTQASAASSTWRNSRYGFPVPQRVIVRAFGILFRLYGVITSNS